MWRGSALIHRNEDKCDFYSLMKPNLAQLARRRKNLHSHLSDVRELSLRATQCGDFRSVGRLTLEAARINSAISEVDVAEMIAA